MENTVNVNQECVNENRYLRKMERDEKSTGYYLRKTRERRKDKWDHSEGEIWKKTEREE